MAFWCSMQDAREHTPEGAEMYGKGNQLWNIAGGRAPASPSIVADAAATPQNV